MCNNLNDQNQYPSERRWTFKQIKLVQKIEIQIDGFNLYLTGWQVPLLLNLNEILRDGRQPVGGNGCTGHLGRARRGGFKINETRTLIPEQCNLVHDQELIIFCTDRFPKKFYSRVIFQATTFNIAWSVTERMLLFSGCYLPCLVKLDDRMSR